MVRIRIPSCALTACIRIQDTGLTGHAGQRGLHMHGSNNMSLCAANIVLGRQYL